MSNISESCKIIEKDLKDQFNDNSRVAIIGIGNEFRYDDIAGLQVVRNLRKKLKTLNHNKNILLVEGETAPHTCFNEIYDWNPTHLIMLDSADLKKDPGTVEFVPKEALHYFSTTSHSGSKQLLLDFLYATLLDLKIYIIGIQVETIFFEKGISESVKMAVNKLTDVLLNIIVQ